MSLGDCTRYARMRLAPLGRRSEALETGCTGAGGVGARAQLVSYTLRKRDERERERECMCLCGRPSPYLATSVPQ